MKQYSRMYYPLIARAPEQLWYARFYIPGNRYYEESCTAG